MKVILLFLALIPFLTIQLCAGSHTIDKCIVSREGDTTINVSFMLDGSNNLECRSLPATADKKMVQEAMKQKASNWLASRAETNVQAIKADLEKTSITFTDPN